MGNIDKAFRTEGQALRYKATQKCGEGAGKQMETDFLGYIHCDMYQG